MHLDEGTIHAWLDGALDAEEAARIDRHAAECAACAAAVAEARGLVAGASRILTALDSVPGGIVPKAASPATTRARRTRSLWTSLHLTPARAAAAAVVVIAAGTALGLRSAPKAARPPLTLAAFAHHLAGALKNPPPPGGPLESPPPGGGPRSPSPMGGRPGQPRHRRGKEGRREGGQRRQPPGQGAPPPAEALLEREQWSGRLRSRLPKRQSSPWWRRTT